MIAEPQRPGPLELLDLPYVFSQAPLLTPSQFADAAKKRGLDLQRGKLEALHRAGVLIPLFRLQRDLRGIRARAKAEGWDPVQALVQEHTEAEWMRSHRAAGLLRDSSEEPFTSRARYRRSSGYHTWATSNFLYSPYQLLSARGLRRLSRFMRRYGSLESGERFKLVLPRWMPPIERLAHRDDRLLIALSAVDHWYRPSVMEVFRGREYAQWRAERQALRPAELLSWIGWSPDEVREHAERLLSSARLEDPLGDWHEVIRLGRPDRWSKLKDSALIANDQRVAAEILLRFYEDLERHGHADLLPPPDLRYRHPLNDRLGVDRSMLDETLTEFGLSPYPSLVLVVEGDVEMEVVPRVMEMLGIPRERSLIDVHNARSVDRDFGLLVSYVALPGLGRELPQGPILLNRPVTRFLLTTDPEGRMGEVASVEGRREIRRKWVRELLARLPEPYRTRRMQEALIRMVHVATWNRKGECFEYAHFTDRQIARAILQVYGRPATMSEKQLVDRLASLRRSGNGGYDNLWKKWPDPKPTKVKVALALWPLLEPRVERAVAVGKPLRTPVVRVVLQAWRLAVRYPRHSMALER